MQPLTQAFSLFLSSLVDEKMRRVAAGHVAPKIWGHPYLQKMQLEQNVKKFKRQQLRKHGFNIPTESRIEAMDVTNAFELKGELACFPRAWRRLPSFPLRCDWLLKPSRKLLRFVVG